VPLIAVALLAGVYLAGLTRDLAEPWIGLHDWNGAFYSQLARNFLRYPVSIHLGMPVVAMGGDVPPPDERSIYPTHPAGLMWLVAGVFRIFGESEWAARIVPIAASVGSLLLFVRGVAGRWGRDTAIVAGLVYSMLPMSVYFGRMVDHEAVCLFFMLLALGAWDAAEGGSAPWRRRIAALIWIIAVTAGIWTDWAGTLFAGVFAIHVAHSYWRGRASIGQLALCSATVAVASLAMAIHVVYAGFGGRWSDVLAVFSSRTGRAPPDVPPTVWRYAVEDFSWPVLVLGAVGLVAAIREARRRIDGPATTAEVRRVILGSEFWILAATGALWVGLFWRQFRIHNYWLYYLGPVATLLCARGALWLRDAIGGANQMRQWGVIIAILGLVVVKAWQGTNNFFADTSIAAGDIDAFKQINAITQPADRVLMFPDPTLIDQWGVTRFRNIGPTQLAYYIDRAYDVEGYVERVASKAGAYPVYVVDLEAVGHTAAILSDLGERFACARIGNYLVFDLRRRAGAIPESADSGRTR
jgi:4-amino-4-deoxy-L-arabinose transferase-like glycosyltransferase